MKRPRTPPISWIFMVFTTLSAPAAQAAVPSTTLSYFVPQSGSLTTPTEGAAAITNARTCPNKDGTQVLRLNSRLKVVVLMADGRPITGVPAQDICILFNGGTPEQGFTGVGDDSIIANSQFNPGCPDVRCIYADAPTDTGGVTYITWIGSTPGQPGVGTRDPLRKWGGWAGDLPLYVMGFHLQGKLTSTSPLGSYTAHVKNFDHEGGRTTAPNQGELVNSLDLAPVQAGGPYRYKYDFDNSGTINSIDVSAIKAHMDHKCTSPIVN